MKKQMIYFLTLLMLVLAVWCMYYFYQEYRPVQYRYGTLVELHEKEQMPWGAVTA